MALGAKSQMPTYEHLLQMKACVDGWMNILDVPEACQGAKAS